MMFDLYLDNSKLSFMLSSWESEKSWDCLFLVFYIVLSESLFYICNIFLLSIYQAFPYG